MATTIEIINLKRVTETGVVVNVDFKVTVSDYRGISQEEVQRVSYENVDPQAEGFVAYENLTEAIVLEWIAPNILVTEERIKASIDHRFDYVNPHSNGKPW